MKTTNLRDYCTRLASLHGSWNRAAEVLGIDSGLFHRIAHSSVKRPTSETLEKLGLQRVEIFVVVDDKAKGAPGPKRTPRPRKKRD